MTKQTHSVSLLTQTQDSSFRFYRRLSTLLKRARLARLRAAVAYARWDGIGLIAPHIESFLKAGGKLQTIYGVGNGITTPDSLLYSLYLQKIYVSHTYAGAMEDEFANATFHPKFFEFRFVDKTIAIIGSANLTGAGMNRNSEMAMEVEIEHGGQLEKQLDHAWMSMRARSRQVTLSLIRTSKRKGELGFESQVSETLSNRAGKPRLRTSARIHPKPLFARILDLENPQKKSRILAGFDTLTARPNRLYLQILPYETGAQSSKGVGYQIQLPVATLATFFGVGSQQRRQVTFRFPEEIIVVSLTHFENNTHRVRLRPLRDVSRPAILKFRRIGSDEYKCSIVPRKDYTAILAEKCTQQTRLGARRWGFE